RTGFSNPLSSNPPPKLPISVRTCPVNVVRACLRIRETALSASSMDTPASLYWIGCFFAKVLLYGIASARRTIGRLNLRLHHRHADFPHRGRQFPVSPLIRISSDDSASRAGEVGARAQLPRRVNHLCISIANVVDFGPKIEIRVDQPVEKIVIAIE